MREQRRLALGTSLRLSETARDRLGKVAAVVLIAIIVVCVVIIIVNLTGKAPSFSNPGRTDRPTTRFSETTAVTPSPPNTPYYRNCEEARKDGRSDIPSTDPAYRRELDHNGDGIACESRKPG